MYRLLATPLPVYNAVMKTNSYSWRLTVTAAITAVTVAVLSACASPQGAVEPPSVSLSNLQVRDVGVFEQRYGMTLRVQNPNPQPLSISGLSYRVQLNDQDFGRGVARKDVTVPAYGEALVDVDVVSSAWQLLQRVRDWGASRTQTLKVGIVGDMSLADRSTQVPFAFQGEIGGAAGGSKAMP